jgi:predicted HicB family RNase H-like nuclease
MPAKKAKSVITETPKQLTEIKSKAVTANQHKNKLIVLKLPRSLKKAARALAKAQDMKLRAWIVELIEQRVAQ